jgi:hypothetical protein
VSYLLVNDSHGEVLAELEDAEQAFRSGFSSGSAGECQIWPPVSALFSSGSLNEASAAPPRR